MALAGAGRGCIPQMLILVKNLVPKNTSEIRRNVLKIERKV